MASSRTRERYKIKTQRTREADGTEVEANNLSILVRRTPEGYEFEADPRHAELIIEELTERGAIPLSTPGASGLVDDREQEE